MKISVALATFNEEENLGKCLETVQNLAGEIIVVDGGSSDKTVKIAQDYGAKVITTNNPPIFHINKQKAIETCSGDWILQLDADERVTPELAKEINLAIEPTINRAINGFWIPRKNWFLGRFLKKGGQYPDYTLRLYRRGKARFPCKSVHEQVAVDGRVGYLRNPLEHYAFPNFSSYLSKAGRYIILSSEEYKAQNAGTGILKRIKYMFLIPLSTFWVIYFRHLGFLDGFPGLVFALFSAIQKFSSYKTYLSSINVKKLH